VLGDYHRLTALRNLIHDRQAVCLELPCCNLLVVQTPRSFRMAALFCRCQRGLHSNTREFVAAEVFGFFFRSFFG